MTATTLIAQLQMLVDLHGDQEVEVCYDRGVSAAVADVVSYGEEGKPETFCFEIWTDQ